MFFAVINDLQAPCVWVSAGIRRETYVTLVTFPKVVCEVMLNVFHKFVSIFWVKVQHFKETFEDDTLEIAVGQRLHIRVGLDHLVLN